MKIAIYPGSFDPITNGHVDIIERAVHIFDKVIVTVARNAEKSSPLFSPDERIALITETLSGLKNIEVDSFEGLMVDHAVKHDAVAAIRGLRALSDFEFEFKMALMNRNLNEEISTLFLMPHAKYTHVSSSMVREAASLGGNVSDYVPAHVDIALKEKYDHV
ncbi:MAG: pantetheine-phosphate adenylyltransferase [Candidatus Marinimicrobia bacterium]|nr:pantetheine-phosphate adenylyltransferase [Candidatus Neomarinimicrobiota bacterium]